MKIDIAQYVEQFKIQQIEQLEIVTKIANKFEDFNSIEFFLTESASVDLSSLSHSHVVYLIKITDFGKHLDSKKLCNIIANFKSKPIKINFKLPKVNIENVKSDILYIGKSSGSFKSRMQQHFCSTSTNTYALHLNKWAEHASEFKGVKLKLMFTKIDFDKLGINDHEQKKEFA